MTEVAEPTPEETAAAEESETAPESTETEVPEPEERDTGDARLDEVND